MLINDAAKESITGAVTDKISIIIIDDGKSIAYPQEEQHPGR